ncbi:hypothetical protein SPBR_07798 [Sporothrix brasiliensis 5110]|uniref:Uncharacterized protein n=1 Tax=Sporothrix brasiliensis 5110 TaxID=1398154 RepID=A0A0C2IT93_9PEZI|nr:uncharacterized protein SPBR_07798 [Sporothrix brasiliensis 5110]KIH88232.1 hypothetical protein SPBR_07798 [Sporothrix brasiliensis 5110]
MGLGILEPHNQSKAVPAAVQLEGEDEATLRAAARLKHGSGRHVDVVLVPQPSDSPNDPLTVLPVVASQIVAHQSYVWAYRYAVITTSVYAVVLFFFVPETAYNRPRTLDIDIRDGSVSSNDDLQGSDATDETKEEAAPAASASAVFADKQPASDDGESGNSGRTTTAVAPLYRGRFSHESYVRSLLSPFATLLCPRLHFRDTSRRQHIRAHQLVLTYLNLSPAGRQTVPYNRASKNR